MPKIVDREKVKYEILLAFEDCIEEKHISKITLRDIAAKARMTHPALLNYFSSKEDIMAAYVAYTKRYMADHCSAWFAAHDHREYPSALAYTNAFLQYMAEEYPKESRPRAMLQACIMARYNQDMQKMVAEEFALWRETLEECMKKVYGDRIGSEEAEALIVVIAGLFVCNYSGSLTGKINSNVLSYFLNLQDQ